MFVKRFISLFIIALLLAAQAAAQTQPTSQPEAKTDKEQQDEAQKKLTAQALEVLDAFIDQQEEAQKKLTAQALELLDVVIKDSERLSLPQNRVYVSISAAELLWQFDEQEARTLFKNAAADLRTIVNDPESEERPRSYRQQLERGQLREKLLFAIARHDGRLARSVLLETRPAPSQKKEGNAPTDSEEEFEARLAAVIAQNDPTQALEMAQKSLAKGFSYNLPGLVSEIQKHDAEAAAQLAGDILTKLKTANLTSNQEAASVAVRLLQMATEPQQAKKNAGTEVKPLLSEQSLRELAEMIASAALNASPEGPGVEYGQVISQLEKYAPSRMQQLRRRAQTDGGNGDEIGEDGQSWQQYQKLMDSGDVEGLLAAAEKAGPGLRESYYRQAALKLAGDGKSDRARQIITEHITDADQRKQILAELDRATLTASASQGNMDETRKYLACARTNEERIAALAQLATAVAQKGDKKIALQLLEEARTLSPGRARYSRQLFAQLMIARAYAGVDPEQSFAILEPTIDQLNELIAAGILLGEFFGEEDVVRDDELVIQPMFQIVEGFQQQFGKDLNLLARSNFTRTRDAAEKFQRYEVRLLARLLVAQSVLAQKPEDALKPAEGNAPVPTQSSN
jgi:hypothetical protein